MRNLVCFLLCSAVGRTHQKKKEVSGMKMGSNFLRCQKSRYNFNTSLFLKFHCRSSTCILLKRQVMEKRLQCKTVCLRDHHFSPTIKKEKANLFTCPLPLSLPLPTFTVNSQDKLYTFSIICGFIFYYHLMSSLFICF